MRPLKAMLVDSWYDSYLGVIVLVRIIDGKLKKGERVKFMSNNTTHHVDRIGVFRPQMEMIDELGPGEIGFLTASIKQVRDTRVGDTISHDKQTVVKHCRVLSLRSLWFSVACFLWMRAI